MFKSILRLMGIIFFIFTLIGCTGANEKIDNQQTQPRQIQNRILVLRNSSSYGDAINDQILQGIENLKDYISDTRIEISSRFSSEDALKVTVEKFIKNNGDFVIATDTLFIDALFNIAADNPEVKFAIVDGKVFDIDQDENIVSYIYDTYTMGYYAGMIASNLSQTGHVAYIGGYEDNFRLRYQEGFRQGVFDTRNGVGVTNEYIGKTEDGFNYSEMAYIIANNKYLENIDIIAHNAKDSAEGIFKAAIENRKFVIGYGIDQTIMVDDFDKRIFYTSVIKRYDVGVDLAIRNFLSGFTAGNLVLDAQHDAIDHIINDANNDIEDIKEEIESMKLDMK